MKPVGVVLHGGASESWVGDATSYAATKVFLEELVRSAEASLRSGAKAVDVATETVAALEDFPEFNAGKGAAVNVDGFHELEAAIVNGDDAAYRAAVCLQTTRNPVRLARAMLTSERANTPVFIAGPGGDELARRLGQETVPNSFFATDRRVNYWKAKRAEASEHGTVGAVVLDAHGSVAVANSTGGMMFKPIGRVGDTAILGSGVYADKRIAVACSGGGEAIMTSMLASRIAMRYHAGAQLAAAVEGAVWEATGLCPSISCGVIAITADGAQTAQCNSRMFATASAGHGVSTRAGLLACTMPVIAPLRCYEDGGMLAGLSKHPTRPNQLTFCLRDRGLADMDREQFLACFQRLRRLARALARVSEADHVALVTFPGGRGGHLFPVGAAADGAPVRSDQSGGAADGGAAGYVAVMGAESMTIRRRRGREACRGGFLLGPSDEFRGILEALWDAFGRGLRAALQGADTGRQWSLASAGAPDVAPERALDVLLASPRRDPHWPSPAPVGAGTGGLTSALGPRTLHVQALCAVAATLRASLAQDGLDLGE